MQKLIKRPIKLSYFPSPFISLPAAIGTARSVSQIFNLEDNETSPKRGHQERPTIFTIINQQHPPSFSVGNPHSAPLNMQSENEATITTLLRYLRQLYRHGFFLEY